MKVADPRLAQVPGRKTDVLDCQWIQQLHNFGLLAGAFRPLHQIVVLRSYMRQHEMLVRYAGQHIQHMHKALEQMNLKLTEVLLDITGVTGTRIIEAILAGQRDPKQLAALRHKKCHNDAETMALALEGNWRAEHRLGLCPGIKKTGGRRLSGRRPKKAVRAANILRLAAYGLVNAKCALGAFLRRLRARLGMPKAITATAHKLARIVYRMLKYGKAYTDVGVQYYERRYRERVLKGLQRRAAQKPATRHYMLPNTRGKGSAFPGTMLHSTQGRFPIS